MNPLIAKNRSTAYFAMSLLKAMEAKRRQAPVRHKDKIALRADGTELQPLDLRDESLLCGNTLELQHSLTANSIA